MRFGRGGRVLNRITNGTHHHAQNQPGKGVHAEMTWESQVLQESGDATDICWEEAAESSSGAWGEGLPEQGEGIQEEAVAV